MDGYKDGWMDECELFADCEMNYINLFHKDTGFEIRALMI